MSEETNVWKRFILDVLDFIRFKVENDNLTITEAESIARTIESNMELYGTIDDISRFFGVPPVNVRATISRKLIAKPIRRVFYPFHKFLKIVPTKWRKK